MRRTILSVLITLMVATPCLSQEVAPDGLFSIEGTRWRSCGVSSSLRFSWDGSGSGFNFSTGCFGGSYGFDEGKVYFCYKDEFCFKQASSFYIDTPLVSIAYNGKPFPSPYVYLFIMQPTGFGVYTIFASSFERMSTLFPEGTAYTGWGMSLSMGIMFKVENNWPGPPEFGFISPDEGEQESILSLTVTCLNTTFRDDPPVDITFVPSDGLTISNISVISNIEIEFDLEIATDAPTRFRDVIVTYDNGGESIRGNSVFEVLGRTN